MLLCLSLVLVCAMPSFWSPLEFPGFGDSRGVLSRRTRRPPLHLQASPLFAANMGSKLLFPVKYCTRLSLRCRCSGLA